MRIPKTVRDSHASSMVPLYVIPADWPVNVSFSPHFERNVKVAVEPLLEAMSTTPLTGPQNPVEVVGLTSAVTVILVGPLPFVRARVPESVA
jgi:hypothetical protein